jgi:UDP-N-acetylmuramoylalanine--D-glutamate ligase
MAYWNEGNGRRVGVVGLGISGTAAATLLKSRGFTVTGFDLSPSVEKPAAVDHLVTGPGIPGEVEALDGLVVSPGVNPWSGIASEARRLGIPVIGEIELAAANTNAGVYAVTGSNGKTTTCEWLGFVLTRAGYNAVVCGNTGYAFSRAVLENPGSESYVLEVSSYQLETVERFRPRGAAILNITPDHLARHGSMEGYASAKARIFLNQHSEDITVLNGDDPNLTGLFGRSRGTEMVFSMERSQDRGAWIDESGMMLIRWDGETMPVMDCGLIGLPGRHNLQNALAVACLAYGAGVTPPEMVPGLLEFTGVRHRIETVATKHGVTWVNDSKSTNPDSLRVALEAASSPVILLAGGRAKETDYSELKSLVSARTRLVILFGEAAPMLSEAWLGIPAPVLAADLPAAVNAARSRAVAGDTVLLSPGCASFDQYRNFEERGDHFRELVEEMQ